MHKIKDKPTIGMLLDIEHYNGEHSGRLAPILIPLIVAAIPILFYMYSGLFTIIPLWIFIPIEIVVVIRVIQIVPGRERYRLSLYRKQINDDYLSMADMNQIKTIYENGCVEYVDNSVHFFILGFNGTIDKPMEHAMLLSDFLTTLIANYTYNIYLQNITDTNILTHYYDRVNRFQKNNSASNFIDILDYDKKLTEETSLVQGLIIELICPKSDWKTTLQHINDSLRDYSFSVFKTIELLTDYREINAILNRDIDSVVNIEELLRLRYKTGDYKGSHVLTYDVAGKDNIVLGDTRTVKIIPDAPIETFHILYEDEV